MIHCVGLFGFFGTILLVFNFDPYVCKELIHNIHIQIVLNLRRCFLCSCAKCVNAIRSYTLWSSQPFL